MSDKNEMKQILKAVVEDLREKKDSFESKYEHSFLGKKAPLEGVAEVRETLHKSALCLITQP